MSDSYYRSYWQGSGGKRRSSAGRTDESAYDDDDDDDGGRTSASGQQHYDDDRGDATGPRKKRVHYSCDECHRRKQRCNRQHPCQHCCARGVPQRCRYSTTGTAAANNTATALLSTTPYSPTHDERTARAGATNGETGAAELSDLKATVQQGFADVLQAVRLSGQRSGGPHTAITDEDEEDLVVLPPRATVFSSRGSRLLDMLSADNAVAVLDPTQSLDASLSIDHALFEMSMRDERRHGPLSQGLLGSLPTPDETKWLFDGYIEEWKLLRYPLMLEPMRRCIDRLPNMRERGFITTDEVTSFAVVAAILARAVVKSELRDTSPSDVKAMFMHARRLMFACMRALCVSDMLGRFDSEKCLALHLGARFLLLDRRVNEAWVCAGSAVRCAQTMGLHRYDATGRPNGEAEECRMLWCALRYDERSFSVMLERPSCINDDVCSTTPPPASATLTTEDADYMRWRHELATYQGRILALLQSTATRAIRMRDVLALDDEIVRFRRQLPSGQMRSPNDVMRVLRFLIHSHTLQARTALLRPFFLRTIPRNAEPRVRQRHLACRRGCVEAACEDLALREDIVRDVDLFNQAHAPTRNMIRTPRWFTSLVICGAYLLTSQINDTAEALRDLETAKDVELQRQARQHLLSFLQLAKSKQHAGQSNDTTLDREMGIVQMFLDRSEGGGKRNGSGNRGSVSTSKTASAPTVGQPSSAHDTPLSVHSTGGTPSRSSVSDARQHNDLQAIFDAWFQSDLNNINMGDIPPIFDVPLPPLPPSMPSASAVGEVSGVLQQPVLDMLPPILAPPPPYMTANEASSTNGSDFWLGFINLLSTQSGQVQ